MNGVLLSITPVGTEWLSVMLAIMGSIPRQIRLRRHPNRSIAASTFGMGQDGILASWNPGSIIEFERVEPVNPIFTDLAHPEDVVFPVRQQVTRLGNVGLDEFHEIVEPFRHESVRALYPELIKMPEGRCFVPGRQRVARSCGYVSMPMCEVHVNGASEVRLHILDNDGAFYDLPLKDPQALAQFQNGAPRELEDITLRIELAAEFKLSRGGVRCYLLATHLFA